MVLLRKAGCWLGVFGLAWLVPPSAQAFDEHCPHCPPHLHDLQVGHRFCAWVKIQHEKAHAQWYTYFPIDAAMMGSPAHAGALFPTWPSSFTPPQPTPASPSMVPSTNYIPGIYQPVGNFNTSAPSYWFAR